MLAPHMSDGFAEITFACMQSRTQPLLMRQLAAFLVSPSAHLHPVHKSVFKPHKITSNGLRLPPVLFLALIYIT